MFKVPTKLLLLVAALVWLLAGASVVGVGLRASPEPWTGGMALGCLFTYVPFLAMFLFISRKHVRRIGGYTEKLTSLFKFFDLPSYLMLAIMMGLGLSTRASGLVRLDVIEFFYVGLGMALVTASVYYVVTYVAVCDELAGDEDSLAALAQAFRRSFSDGDGAV